MNSVILAKIVSATLFAATSNYAVIAVENGIGQISSSDCLDTLCESDEDTEERLFGAISTLASSGWCDTGDYSCTVVGTPPPYFPPIPQPPAPPPGDPGDPHPGEGGPGGGGDPSPTDPETAARCIALIQEQVDGCNRQLAYSGTPQTMLPDYGRAEGSYWGPATLPSDQFWRSTNWRIDGELQSITNELNACYANHSYDPVDCESDFLSAFNSRVGPLVTGSHTTGWPLRTPAEVFQVHANQMLWQAWYAQVERSSANPLQWISWSSSALGFTISIPILTGAWNPFNNLLEGSRTQRACQYWMEAWDGLGCS